jgi:hypothetical protein
MRPSLPTLIFPLLLVTACSSGAEAPPPAASATAAVDPGLLLDPNFIPESDGRGAAWVFSQHAGEDSYRFDIEDGVLSITRIATQPWGQAVQVVEAEGLEGQWIEFSAELSGSLVEPVRPELEPSGVSMRMLGFPPGTPRIVGRSILEAAVGEPPVVVGELPWTRHAVRIQVPEGTTHIEVAIVLGLGGTLRARNPALRVVEAGVVAAPEPEPGGPDTGEPDPGRGQIEDQRLIDP